MKQKFTFLLALLCTVWIGARADDVTVTPETAQAALDAATDGQNIILSAGTYSKLYLRCRTTDITTDITATTGGNVYLRNIKNLTIKAADDASVTCSGIKVECGYFVSSSYAASNQTDLQSGNSFVSYISLENVTIDGINFDATSGSAFSFGIHPSQNASYSKVYIDGLTISNCTATGDASSTHFWEAGMCIENLPFPNMDNKKGLNNLKFENNTLTSFVQPLCMNNSTAYVNNVTITGNTFKNCSDNIINWTNGTNAGTYSITNNTAINMNGRFMRSDGVGSGCSFTFTGNKIINPTAYDEDGTIVKLTHGNSNTDQDFTVTATDNEWNNVGYTTYSGKYGYGWYANGISPVAKIGETKYVTVASALADVPNDGTETTITLLGNVDLGTSCLTVASGQKIILDLNGNEITSANSTSKGTIYVNGGAITIKDDTGKGKVTKTGSSGSALYCNTSSSDITITGGSFTGVDYAVYGYNGGNFTISGGSFSGATAFRTWDAGTSTISGGTFTGTKYAVLVSSDNANVSIADGTFTGGIYKKNGTLTISGGTYDSDVAALCIDTKTTQQNGDTWSIVDMDEDNATAKFDGTLYNSLAKACNAATSGTVELLQDNTESVTVKNGVTIKLNDHTHGTFSLPTDLKNTYKIVEADDAVSIVARDGSEDDNVAKTEFGSTTVYSNTLAAAISSVTTSDPATVTLLKDVECSCEIGTSTVSRNITVDLNGHKITGVYFNSRCVFLVNNGSSLTINDSSEGKTGTIVYGNSVNYAAIWVGHTKGENADNPAQLTVNGGTIIGQYYAICGNGAYHNTIITINGGTMKGEYDGDSQGIYHPQKGILNINGGTIEGYSTAVEIRAGTINVTGGTLVSTATTYDCNPNGNGSTTVGAALALAQHTTKIDISANISGGSFTGVKAINESNPQENDPTPQVTMSVTGGLFNGDITTADVKNFISGGYYSVAAGDERTALQTSYVADGYTAIDNDGKNANASVETYPTMIGAVQTTQTEDIYTVDETEASTITTESSADLQAAKTAVETNTLVNTNVSGYATNIRSSLKSGSSAAAASKNYVTVKLKSAVTTKTEFVPTSQTGDITVVKTMTFDVKPVYIVVTTSTDASGNTTTTETETEIPASDIEKGITFRLPVDKNVTAVAAEVFHINESLGYMAIQGDATSGKYIEVTSKSFSEFSYTLVGQEKVIGDVYAGSTTATEGQTLAQFATARETFRNAIMVVDEKYEALVQDQTNVVVKYSDGNDGYTYSCPKFVLTDPATNTEDVIANPTHFDFHAPAAFTAVTGSYTRSLHQYAQSCCLPFAVSATEDFDVLTYSSSDDNNVYFGKTTSVDAGAACLLYCESAVGDYTWSFSNTEITNTSATGDVLGTFTAMTGFDQSYSAYYEMLENGTQFGTAPATLYQFRSAINLGGSNPQTAKARLALVINDDDVTAINSISTDASAKKDIYTINGVKVSEIKRPGLYIINGKKTFVK